MFKFSFKDNEIQLYNFFFNVSRDHTVFDYLHFHIVL